jgi:two-component system nitrogen regulation response regulator GlnG
MMQNLKNKKVLLVDDDDSIRWVINETLCDLGLKVIQSSNVEDAIELINESEFNLVISDVRMPGSSGLDLLNHCQKYYPDMPVIIMTAHSDLDSAVKAYTKGAFEYLPKPFDIDEVSEVVTKALNKRPVKEKLIEPTSKNNLSIIGESPAMQNLYRAIGRLSNSHVSVLIKGESGTGKELVAQALHQHSPRKDKPFIALNMAAIPKDLIESELFGHEKGAFTGASSRYLGRFEQANNGTLFLDEIGDMPLETQTRLLRVLSEGAFYRVGSAQPTTVDVRIVAATHQDLLLKVEEGEFREDLYHRLNVIPLNLPSLRERKEDVELLANYFLFNISQELNEPQKELSKNCLTAMQDFSWPGNVRQLENTCRWLSVMSNSQYVLKEDLPEEFHENTAPRSNMKWQKQLSVDLKNRYEEGDETSLIQAQKTFEQLLIKTALELSSGKKAEAARLLGWGRNTLTRKQNE